MSEYKQSEIGRIPVKWKVDTLENIAEVVDPHPSHRAPSAVSDGVPFAGIGDIDKYGNIDSKKARIVSKKVVQEHQARYQINKNSIGYGRVGTVGKVVKLRPQQYEFTLSPTLAVINPRDNVDSVFVYQLLKSKSFFDRVKTFMTGTTRPTLGIKALRAIKVPVPPLSEQKGIANKLGVIDDKIELNQQTNETLEAMAQSIFKSWFVDFDPVCAKIDATSAGRDPNRAAMAVIAGVSLEQGWDAIDSALQQKLDRMSADQRTQLRQTAQLFPDELVESEIGEVPKGWGYSTIGKEFDIVNGQSPPGSSYNEEGEGVPFYQGRTDFGFRFPTQRVYCTEPKRFAKKGDTLLSVRAPVGDLNISIEDCCIGRGLASLRHISGSISYTYYAMKQVQVQIEAYEATGTVFGSINQKQLKALDTIAPNEKVINEFHRIVDPIDSKIMNQVFMNRELSELRDTLLPKLISGEIEL